MLSGVAAAFDRIGEAYDAAFGDREAQRGWGRELLTRLPAGGRVLGHGCGSGSPTAVQLAEAGLEVVGVDESERMLELARLRVPSGRFERRDLRALGPELGSFDAVASFFALLMLPCADIPLVLAGLAARLRTGGLLALGRVGGPRLRRDRLPRSADRRLGLPDGRAGRARDRSRVRRARAARGAGADRGGDGGEQFLLARVAR